jgi:catechol-2,3-dioxygenase
VRQLERVGRFYQDIIGLELVEREATMVLLGRNDRTFLTLPHCPNAVPDECKIRSATTDAWGAWKAPARIGIGHVHFRAGAVQAAARYYAETLNLAVTRSGPHASFMLWDGYHHHFAFYTWESAGAVQRNPDMSGLHSIALETSQKASFEDPWGNQIISAKALNKYRS